jgi:hypothetical protein
MKKRFICKTVSYLGALSMNLRGLAFLLKTFATAAAILGSAVMPGTFWSQEA